MIKANILLQMKGNFQIQWLRKNRKTRYKNGCITRTLLLIVEVTKVNFYVQNNIAKQSGHTNKLAKEKLNFNFIFLYQPLFLATIICNNFDLKHQSKF